MTRRGRRGRIGGARPLPGPVVFVLASICLAACTTTVPGVGVPGEPAGAPPTAPAAPSATALPFAGNGPTLESHRLAAATPLIEQHFPDLIEYCDPQGGLTTAWETEQVFFNESPVADILDAHGFTAAWGQCGTDGPDRPRTLTVTVELADPASARAAAEEMATALRTPQTRSSTILDGGQVLLSSDGTQDTAQVWVPAGRLVGYTSHVGPAGQGLEGISRVAADHLALMTAFTPTPPAELGNLPSDPYGLVALAARPPGRSLSYLTGPYDLEGYLRNALDPFAKRDLLAANGFTGMHLLATDASPLSYRVLVFAFPSAAQTNAVYAGFAESERARLTGATPFVLPAIPDAPCFRLSQERPPPEPDPLDSLNPSATPAPSGPITVYVQRCYVGYGGYLAAIFIGGVAEPDDYTAMTRLLTAQRDLIDG